METYQSQPSTGTIAPGEIPAHDPVSHPRHYQGNGLEVIEVIESWLLGPHLANALKYVLRYREKGGEQDLRKACWYLDRAKTFHGPLGMGHSIGPSIDRVIAAFKPSQNIQQTISAIYMASVVPPVGQNSWLDAAIAGIDAEIESYSNSGGAG